MSRKVIKRVFFLFAAVLVISCSSFAFAESAATIVASGTCGEDATWKLDSEGVLTVSGTGSMSEFDSAFCPNDVKKAVLEDGIETVYLKGCSNMKELVLPDSVITLEPFALQDCSNLYYYNLPSSLTTIGESAFENCQSISRVYIPDSVTYLGSEAFRNCQNLHEVTIPEGITAIGPYTFYNCIRVSSIEVPDSVKSIGKYAFYNCMIRSVNIPDGVTSIEAYTFYDCGLKSVKIPASVISIGNSAFRDCGSLKSVSIPNSVTTIGNSAFRDCIGLDSVTLSESVKTIGNSAFRDCCFVEKVVIPENVSSIGENAFLNCEDVGIYGKANSYVHVYAKQNNIPFFCFFNEHNFSAVWTVDKKGSVDAAGSKSHHCKLCDGKKDDTKIPKIKTKKLSKTEYVYNGKVKNPTVVIKDAAGKIVSSKNYTVKKMTARKNVGEHRYKVTFKNQYKGTISLYFYIFPKTPTMKVPAAISKGFTARWYKIDKQVTGYEIMYATNSTFTSGKKTVVVKNNKTTSKTIKKLKAKKTYYVRVRSYKIVGDYVYLSNWSKAKNVKTKG